MRPSVFKYRDYKQYLEDFIASMPNKGRGIKLRISESIQCQSGFISQVLGGPAHFSAEQLERINEFCEHTPLESEFLLFLLHKQRAGTEELRKFYQRQLDRITAEQLNVTSTILVKDYLESWEQEVYYSQWYYIAVHMAITIEQFQNLDALCERLHLPRSTIITALEFLKKAGLALEEHGRFRPGKAIIHLPGDSHLVAKHHTHLRLKALDSASHMDRNDLHYSSVTTISKTDFERLKVLLLDALKKARSTINASKEEDIYGFNIDLFRWK